VIERRHCTSFTLKASQTVIIVCHSGRQHLDGNFAAKTRVFGPIHLSHSAGANRRENFILTEFVT
jgi:hypothetical protein